MEKSEKENHMNYWRESGQSKKAYSELAGINYPTFISWFKAERKKQKEVQEGQPGSFVRLEHSTSLKKRVGVEIIFPNGIRLQSEQSITTELLKSLHHV